MAKSTRYYWDVYKIQEKIEFLEDLLKKETNDYKRVLIKSDILLLKSYISDFFKESQSLKFPNLLNCYKDNKEELIETSFAWSDFKDFKEIIGKGFNESYLEIPTMTLSKEDILSLTHDFYKSLNPFFYGNFMKHFYRRFDHVNFTTTSFDNCDGFSLCMVSRNESFIEIVRNNTIEDVLTSIHEYEHATSSSINPYHLSVQNSMFVEFDTQFMELIAQDYLKNVTNNRGIPIIRHNDLLEYSEISVDINDLISLINAEKTTGISFTSNKVLKDIAFNECDIFPEEIESFLHTIYANTTRDDYLLGFILAIELYKIYKEDKDKALHILKNIIMSVNTSNEQYYSNIKRLGLLPNLSVRQFQKETEQEIKRTLTRKKVAKK